MAAGIWGKPAARDDKPITSNPFPEGDVDRAAWEDGWREIDGAEPAPPPDAATATPEKPDAYGRILDMPRALLGGCLGVLSACGGSLDLLQKRSRVRVIPSLADNGP